MHHIKLFVATFIICVCLDYLWLGVLAKSLYLDSLTSLLKPPVWYAAILVYLLIVFGILVFVLPKAGNHYLNGILWGATFGLVVYGIYDFTNYATLANWPLHITLIDLAWGIVLCGVTSVFAIFMRNWLA